MRAFSIVLVAAVLVGNVSTAAASLPRGAQEERVASAFAAGEHETAYDVDAAHAGRAHNVELAASLLDGAVIEAGDILSFNERVGERTIEAGFAEAPELHDGHVHEGIGGGVCQVATTLHVASLEAGLEIVEHRVHSIPSRYAAPGLDATVYFGRIDFRVRNPYAFPVRVHAHAHEGTLVVSLETDQPVSRATIDTRTIRTLEIREQEIADATLAPGARVVEQRGRAGMVVRVRATREDGTVSEQLMRYGADPRIVRVGA